MDLSRYIVLDITSGTCFNAAHAVLINQDKLSSGDSVLLDDGASDSMLSDLGERSLDNGAGQDLERIAGDSAALDAIAKLLSGVEWNVDTLMSISDQITATGRVIEDLPSA